MIYIIIVSILSLSFHHQRDIPGVYVSKLRYQWLPQFSALHVAVPGTREQSSN